MNKKIVFLDVDGTLCNDEGLVPNSARDAVRALEKMVIMFFYVLDVHKQNFMTLLWKWALMALLVQVVDL